MKYGLLVEKKTGNIGDDIQSYAAMQYLPQIDYFIDREEMNSFVSTNNERVAVIMNAWYMNKKYNWPPSNNIYPICYSMHFAQEDTDSLELGLHFLEGIGGKYLKEFQPIGCRDRGTVSLLKKEGIEGFFSGCLTLTLPRQKKITPKQQYVCLVDLPGNVIEKAKELIGNKFRIEQMTHLVNPIEEWTEKKVRVESFLSKYQNSSGVITTRLHCALPCLAMGVPVLYINMFNEYRTKDYLDFLDWMDQDQFMKLNYNPLLGLKNKSKHITIANKLREDVNKAVIQCAEDKELKTVYYSDKERQNWQINLLTKKLREIVTENKQLKNRLEIIEDQYFIQGKICFKKVIYSKLLNARKRINEKNN